jgi:hypothetical protein
MKITGILVKKVTPFLAALAVVLVGCSTGIKGDGVVVTTNITVSQFSSLEASGAYTIQWASGTPALSITTDQNLLPFITTKVTGGSLEIDQQQNLRPTKGIMIIVSSPALKDVRLNGASSLTASNVSGQELKLESNGASSIHVDGSVTNLEVNFSGAGSLSATALQARTARVTLNGAASADVTASESLEISISGACSVTYGGRPKSVQQEVSGAGKIRAR